MASYVSRVTLRVLGKDLDDVVVSMSAKSSSPTKPVNTMNKKRRARGIKTANSNFSVDLDCERINDATVPDWHVLRSNNTPFTLVETPDNGDKPVEYGPCYITDVADSASDGDSSRKVTVLVLDRK